MRFVPQGGAHPFSPSTLNSCSQCLSTCNHQALHSCARGTETAQKLGNPEQLKLTPLVPPFAKQRL